MSDALFDLPEITPSAAPAYRVLARKYRPTSFADLHGQDALVKTLTNAFASGRIAHAFMLTGVRGVGKTTTARIIAKGLNCVEGPTITPCGKCEACISITEGRNVDVLEIDAASHTGVDNIRELTENAKYAPTSVRTKVYIIDEVHMLSKGAFNALLKTLEEPPPHVKFIFATTEIRKVPVTVLSRCQRYDLRRIEFEVLMKLFGDIAAKENVEIDDEALRLISRAADGSARDGTSLLDQAIARSGDKITGEQVRDMLGLADRGLSMDLLMAALHGDPAEALAKLEEMHRSGADALTVLQDLLDATHQLSRFKALPEQKGDTRLTASEQQQLSEHAGGLSMPVLARAWQVLLKGVPEVQSAPQPMAALEMILLRLAYIGSLPPPGDLLKKITEAGLTQAAATQSAMAPPPPSGAPVLRAAVGMNTGYTQTQAVAETATQIALHDWKSAVALFAEKRELQLYAQLFSMVECISLTPGHLEIFIRPGAQPGLSTRVASLLQDWTGARWMVSLAKASSRPTLAEEEEARAENTLREAAEHPLVKAVLLAFPGAKLEAVREKVETVASTEESDITPQLSDDEDN